MTPVPDIIIDEHLTRAKPEYIAVCLYILRWRKEAANQEPSIERTAMALGLTNSAVADALMYWAGFGFNLAHKPPETARLLNRPAYSVGEIEKAAGSSDDVRFMFGMAERIFGKPLTYNDMSLLMGFYDWLALPVPVIEVLLDYCVSSNKKNSRYLEKVAINWADSGITTVDEAEAYIKTWGNDYREILKAFGHSRRDPTSKEVAYMRKWLREYELPLELVLEACGATVINTGGTSFAYADSIIENWRKKGITTLEQVKADDQAFRDGKASVERMEKPAPAARQKSRFANYKGREWDFAELERLAAEYADKAAEG